MATSTEKKEFDPSTLGEYERQLFRDYSEDKDAHDEATADYDAFEAMHEGKTYDAVSRETTNGLTDSMTATIYLERAARVAGQLPEGEVQAFGRRDRGKALFMDILRQKWIYPNANSQMDFETKMFLWQYGSSEYKFMPMHYDLTVSPNGYFGPDCWLWSPRMFIPQSGFTSVKDMDHVHALALKGYKFFEDIKDEPDSAGWKKDVIDELDEQLRSATLNLDPARQSGANKKRNNTRRQILIATRYESGKEGHWISFLPDFGYKVIRDIPNPHKNGRIPFVIKPCIPSFDSFYGVGDFQRSMPMQFANDGLDNFYFQGIKINLFPRTVANAQTIIRHTMSPDPGSVWEVNGNVNDVKQMDGSTAGLSTYNSAKGMAKGAIQSIAGTTDTRQNAESASDPGFGKTPEAIKKISERESTRDNQDRSLLEKAMVELLDGMMSLIPTIKEKIPVDMFADEIADIYKTGNHDIKELFQNAKQTGLATLRKSDSGEQARIKIDPQKLQGLTYKFKLEPNSTAKKSKEAQLQALVDFLDFMGKMPNALQDYKATSGKMIAWDKVFARYGTLADIPGMDEFFVAAPTVDTGTATDDPNAVATDASGQPIAQPPVDPNTGMPVGQPPMPPQAPMTPQVPIQPQMVQPAMPDPNMPLSMPVAPQGLHPAIQATLQAVQGR